MVLDTILPILEQLVADPISNYVVSPIKRHVSYAFKCDSKLQELQDQFQKLNNRKLRLQHSVDEYTRAGDEIYPYVTRWLTTAEMDMGEAEELLQRKEEESKCFFGFCPNLRTRYQLSKNAEKKAQAIRKLCNEEGLDPISFERPPEIALPSRVLMLNQIIDALKDPNLYMIGVYGMGGVGKTTIAEEVYARTLEKLFETIVVVSVSRAPDIRRIQRQIANFMGLKFPSGEILGRASLLCRRLENSGALIILDDVWEKLDFNTIGIPSQGHRCKIILTSRDRDLLSTEMGAQKVFPLEPLEEEEALSLFQFYANMPKDPKFHDIAIEIANKCSGLPLFILTVAQELKDEEFDVWERTPNQLLLGHEEIYGIVYDVLELSYSYLPEEEMKSFFLLCALVGQSNIQIQYLLVYSIGLGLFKHIHTIEDARDKVLTFIAKLKSKSLLLDGDMVGFVKIHDLVRYTALNIASRVHRDFMGKSGVRLRDWPDIDCKRISLPFCHVGELPAGMNYPDAELFLLFTEDLSLQIPDSFFNGIKKLKVIDLTGMCLVHLPSSIGLLIHLRTLCLHKCELDDVSILGELINLEFLSFAFSNLVELPGEIEHLIRLKLLDLRGCSSLEVIPSNVLSRLSSLEELYVLNSFVRWNFEGNANIMELYCLSHLSTLEIEIQDPTMIPVGFKRFSQLRRYKISIGNVWDWKGQYKRSRTLKLQVEAAVPLGDGIEILLKNCEDLYLDGVRGIESLFYAGFPLLKDMHIQNDYDTEHLIKSSNAFQILESLSLSNLPRLESICSSQLRTGNFAELQILKISNCDKLTILVTFPLGKCLSQLREVEVESCERMEAIVGEGIEFERRSNGVVGFSQLRSLKLKKLPKLEGFCKLNEKSDQMGLLFSRIVSFPNLTSLEVSHMGKMKCLFHEFNDEGSSNDCSRMFPALQSLSVTWMENLTEWKYKSDSQKANVFPRLENATIQYCPKLTYLPTSDPSKLVKLEMKHCRELIPIIGMKPSFASLSGLSIMGCPKLTDLQIWPQSVKRFKDLSVCKCEWLIRVPHDMQKVSYLTSLEIYCCRRLLCFPEDILPKLTKLQHLSVGAFSEELDDFKYLNQIKDLLCLEELEIWGSDFFGREMCSLPNQLQHLGALKSLKIVGFTAMESLPEWLANLQYLCSLSLDYCRNLGCETTVTIIQQLPNLLHLSVSSCPVLQRSESEWLQPLQSRKVAVELSHVSIVRAGLGY